MAKEKKIKPKMIVDGLTIPEREKVRIDAARAKAKEERLNKIARSRDIHRGLR